MSRGGRAAYFASVALLAAGQERWEFDAGTGCTSCDGKTERNEIESSPAVVGNLVYFGMDVNSGVPAKGGAYAVDATDGHLVWYFDIDSGSTCRPKAADDVRRFDGYHSAAQLRLADDFFSTRPGCNFVRRANPCDPRIHRSQPSFLDGRMQCPDVSGSGTMARRRSRVSRCMGLATELDAPGAGVVAARSEGPPR